MNVLSLARFKIYSSLTDAGDACSTRVRSRSRHTVAFQKSKRRISVGASGRFSLACEGERDSGRRGKTVFAVLPQHTCVNHVDACSR